MFGPRQAVEISALAKMFPPPTEAERVSMRNDIQDNGVLIPVKVWHGAVVEGRTRVEISRELGIPCPYETLDHSMSLDDVKRYVISANVQRRHLSTSQRSLMLVASLRSGKQNGHAEASNRQIAEWANVSPSTVDAATKVHQHGSKALKEAVKKDHVTVFDAAKIVDRPAKVQDRAIERVVSGKAKTLTQAVKNGRGRSKGDVEGLFHSLKMLLSQLTKTMDTLNTALPGKQHYTGMERGLEAAAKCAAAWKELCS